MERKKRELVKMEQDFEITDDEAMFFKKKIGTVKRLSSRICILLGAFFILTAAAFFMLILPAYTNAKNTGASAGSKLGDAVGWAVGSYRGITDGMAEGAEDGKEDAQSAKDTDAEIANEMKNMDKLEVMIASVQLLDIHKYADVYADLREYKGNVIFSVDLSQSEISLNEETIEVTIPKPTAELNIDYSSTETKAVWKKNSYSKSAEDGYVAYVNSQKEIQSKSLKEIDNYEQLSEQAEEMAKEQIKILIESMSDKTVVVNVKGE